VKEELQEFEEALEKRVPALIEEELGDLLFSVAQLTRHCGFEPEQTLRAANRKFLNRYNLMLKLCYDRGLNFEDLPPTAKESLWQEVKAQAPEGSN